MEQYGLECANKKKFGLFGSLFFVGVVIGSLVLPRLSDIIGRKKITLVGNLVHIFAVLVAIWSHNLNLSLFMIFIMGIAMGGRVFVGFILMSENLPKKDTSLGTSLMFGLDSFCICFSALYFKHISKDWRGLLIAPLILHSIATFVLAFQHESPKYYFATG